MKTSSVSRRGFLGGSAAALAGIALTGCSNSETSSTSQKSTEETKSDPLASAQTDFSEQTGDKLKITTLSENTNTGHEDLTAEFGFSALIELGDNKVIFDTAKQGDFIEHAKKLGADIESSNIIVLSHAHYDHCGGVMKYLETYGATGKTVHVKDCFFEGASDKYYDDVAGKKFDFTDGNPGYFPIGIKFTQAELEATGAKINFMTGDSAELVPGITLYGNFKREPLDPNQLIKQSNGDYVLDDFDEEVAIGIETSKGLIVVSGCSHNGIENIVKAIKERSGKQVYAVIGGFHLLDATEKQIQNSIETFSGLGVKHMGVSHCIGETAKKMFVEQLPEIAFLNTTGSVFEMK